MDVSKYFKGAACAVLTTPVCTAPVMALLAARANGGDRPR